jgi:integration host factor subunit beta
MVKSQLIRQLARDFPSLTRVDAQRVVNVLLAQIRNRLAAGGRAELRGFGVFRMRTMRRENHHNPRTGEPVIKGDRRLTAFLPSRVVLERMNPELPQRRMRKRPG